MDKKPESTMKQENYNTGQIKDRNTYRSIYQVLICEGHI